MNIAVIVPAYNPTEDMIPMLNKLCEDDRLIPVVVNDGSSGCESIFSKVPDKCKLLVHDVNKGKGAAIKTALRCIMNKLPECEFAVTADADGQHRYEDILRVLERVISEKNTLVLGSRKFDGDVPFKSRAGNAITRQVFAAASGVKIFDTQTGLRAFPRELFHTFAEIPGDRYEYEINMLLYAARNGVRIVEETIATVYLNNNSASSFRAFRDGFRIYACILKFAASSVIGFIVDTVMLLVLNNLILSGIGDAAVRLTVSTAAARIISATVNFIINKKMVFGSKGKWLPEIVRYALLAAAVLLVKELLINLLNVRWGWPLLPSDILIEFVLFCVNFFVQGRVVYSTGKI